MGRPEIVVNSRARSGDCLSAGASVSRSQRAFSVSAAAFMLPSLYVSLCAQQWRPASAGLAACAMSRRTTRGSTVCLH